MKPRRRTILKVIALLAASAAVNVVVAWTLMFPWIWREMDTSWPDGTHLWPRSIPQHWPNAPQLMIKTSLGIRIEEFDADKEPASYMIRLYLAGWPMRSLIYEEWSDLNYDGHRTFLSNTEGHPVDVLTLGLRINWTGCGFYSDGSGKRLPIKPIWPGFAVNTLLYAGVLWMLFCGPFALRWMIRRRRGHCPACAYPIGQSPVCTECGAALTVPRNGMTA